MEGCAALRKNAYPHTDSQPNRLSKHMDISDLLEVILLGSSAAPPCTIDEIAVLLLGCFPPTAPWSRIFITVNERPHVTAHTVEGAARTGSSASQRGSRQTLLQGRYELRLQHQMLVRVVPSTVRVVPSGHTGGTRVPHVCHTDVPQKRTSTRIIPVLYFPPHIHLQTAFLVLCTIPAIGDICGGYLQSDPQSVAVSVTRSAAVCLCGREPASLCLCSQPVSAGDRYLSCWIQTAMGGQISKSGAKGEAATVEKPGEPVAASPSKTNGQENGHVKANGDASPAAAEAEKEEVQANGSAPAEETVKEEAAAAAEAVPEKEAAASAEGESTEPASPAEGEASTKTEEAGSTSTPSTSNETPKKKKKRFSFKKSFKLSGFSFKKEQKGEQ
ncbi:unnamed protein product [Ranitomeya imitator]|uniref:Myristoylated alanine-rich C-kinase substrate n=1 Tax=Ranitomeya imitator TaxID=111125 RepID=A0ABN9KR95_9NEOB|nr:unnamed protein product [Ranitomeya imitator]